MDKAGAVEQHINCRQLRHQLRDGDLVQHVQRQGRDVRHALERFKQRGIHIGRPHPCALRCQRQCAGAPYSLAGRSDQCSFSFKSHKSSYRVLPDVTQSDP